MTTSFSACIKRYLRGRAARLPCGESARFYCIIVTESHGAIKRMVSVLGAVVAVYLLSMLALSVYAGGRVQTEEDYVVAGRRLPLGLAWGTLLATWFGAATVLGAAEAARLEGMRGTVLDPFATGGALIIAGLFFARPLWKMKLLTIADFYGRVFGSRAELVASVILVPGYFGWVAAQYVALAGLQETFFGTPPAWGILLAAGIVGVYTYIGGMWSVTLTDTLQISVVLVTLVVLAGSVFTRLGGGSLPLGIERLFAQTHPDFLTLMPEAGLAAGLAWVGTWASGLFGNIPGQDLMQRVFASRDARTASQACLLAGGVYIGFGLVPVGLGLASRILRPGADEGRILAVLAEQFLSPGLTIVFVLSLISIIVSTCTSAVLSPATVLAHNILGRLGFLPGRALTRERVAVLAVIGASVAVAYSGRTILELLELSLSTVLVSLFVPLVAGLHLKARAEMAALLALLLGAAVWLLTEVGGGVLGALDVVPSALSGLLASCAGFGLGIWLEGRRRPEARTGI